MSPKDGVKPDEHATDAEIEASLRALSDVQLVRLGRAANYRALALAGLGLGISGDDLLQEAIARTVAQRKHWRKTVVSFEKHLLEAMRNIANHAKDELAGASVVAATTEDDRGYLDGVPVRSRVSDAERAAAAHEQLGRITQRFANDDEVGLVLEGLASGMTGPEIQADLKITQTQFETIMTRLRRGVDRKEGWRP
jgi:CRP-like cAMP-binding protein